MPKWNCRSGDGAKKNKRLKKAVCGDPIIQSEIFSRVSDKLNGGGLSGFKAAALLISCYGFGR